MKNKKGIQEHHISYNPERKKVVTKEWHVNHHGHGTGPVKGYHKKSNFRLGFLSGVSVVLSWFYRKEIIEVLLALMTKWGS